MRLQRMFSAHSQKYNHIKSTENEFLMSGTCSGFVLVYNVCTYV